jgi:hypothetical protein
LLKRSDRCSTKKSSVRLGPIDLPTGARISRFKVKLALEQVAE